MLIFNEALGRMGIKLDMVILPLKRSSVYVNAGKFDGEISRVYSYNETYGNLVRVEEHLSKLIFVAYSRDKDLKFSSWEDFKGLDLKVGYIRGSKKARTQLRRMVSESRLFEANTIGQALGMLKSGKRIDVFVDVLGGIKQELRGNKELSKYSSHIYLSGVMEEVTAHAFLYKKYGYLGSELSGHLKAMKKEGLFEQYRTSVGLHPDDLHW
ncbi:hypothetical protein L4C34_09840 [Vibrio profundum]|uniref:hypothetical protein n=1 Tax=Vibrio profundum TaxID=2910247 RepID=UPI003D0E1BC9